MTYIAEIKRTDGIENVSFENYLDAIAFAKEECKWESTISTYVYDEKTGEHYHQESGDFAYLHFGK